MAILYVHRLNNEYYFLIEMHIIRKVYFSAIILPNDDPCKWKVLSCVLNFC
jgi:hypothetical protein